MAVHVELGLITQNRNFHVYFYVPPIIIASFPVSTPSFSPPAYTHAYYVQKKLGSGDYAPPSNVARYRILNHKRLYLICVNKQDIIGDTNSHMSSITMDCPMGF